MPGTDITSQVQSGGDTLTVTVAAPPREGKFWELGETDILQGTGSNRIAKLKELHGKEKIHGLLKPAPERAGFDEVLGAALKVKVPIPLPVPLMFWTPETIVEDRTLIGPLTETSETLGLVRMTQTQLPIAAWARIVIEKVPPETGIVLSAKFPLIVIGVWQEGQSTDSTSEQSCA